MVFTENVCPNKQEIWWLNDDVTTGDANDDTTSVIKKQTMEGEETESWSKEERFEGCLSNQL